MLTGQVRGLNDCVLGGSTNRSCRRGPAALFVVLLLQLLMGFVSDANNNAGAVSYIAATAGRIVVDRWVDRFQAAGWNIMERSG